MDKKVNKRILLIGIVVTAVIIMTAIIGFVIVLKGYVQLNNPSEDEYPVKGVDVSHYQGNIDWRVLSSQNIEFAFIKATEGSSHVDSCFSYNYQQAQQCDISVGAYHFFSFDSSGKTQAENFIKIVTPYEGMLPPVIDLEFYGDKSENPPAREIVTKELDEMIALLREHYDLYPIIYTTNVVYKKYLVDDYSECDIWIRDIIDEPELSDGRDWTFWQYTNREKLDGYDGKEKYIDMNVFNGSREEFVNYSRYTKKGNPVG